MSKPQADLARTGQHDGASLDGNTALIDIGLALELLASAGDEPQDIVRRALSLAQVSDDDLEALRKHSVRDLYHRGRLHVRLTLGSLAVLDAAERSRGRGHALDDAMSVAARFVDLLPDTALATNAHGTIA